MAAPATDQRLRWLDALRGFAACWVVSFHLNKGGDFAASAYQAAVGVGWLGVIVFFVVSGLCIQMAAQKVGGVGAFARHRFWRIYPPYLASLVLTALIIVLRQLASGAAGPTALPQGAGGWLAHALMAFAPTTSVEGINWVYWTLTCEVAFYAVIGLWVWLKPLKWPILIGLTAAACLAGPHLPAALFPLRYWSFFALGAALAEWRLRRGGLPVLLAALAGVDMALHQGPMLVATAAVTALTAAACLTRWGAALNREPVFSRIGQWSYSLYLIHVPIGAWLGVSLAQRLFGASLRHDSLAAHMTIDLGLLAASCLVAWLFWRLVERPSIAMMRGAPARPAAGRNPILNASA
jgi:peptidoglycan/LPS O-acetylase OafA/YrhL